MKAPKIEDFLTNEHVDMEQEKTLPVLVSFGPGQNVEGEVTLFTENRGMCNVRFTERVGRTALHLVDTSRISLHPESELSLA